MQKVVGQLEQPLPLHVRDVHVFTITCKNALHVSAPHQAKRCCINTRPCTAQTRPPPQHDALKCCTKIG